MRTQQRNKKQIYLCHKYIENGIAKFKKPIPIKENYSATNTDSDLIAMGMEYPKYLRIKSDIRVEINGKWQNRKDLYHAGDRVYVYNEPPKEHDVLCKNADYEVDTKPVETLNQLEVMLFNLSGKN